jgi:excisionase family DNA binding protein
MALGNHSDGEGRRGKSPRRTEVAEDRRLLTALQLADKFAVDIRTVRRWCAAGKLRPIKLGRRLVRFRPEEVERFERKGWS